MSSPYTNGSIREQEIASRHGRTVRRPSCCQPETTRKEEEGIRVGKKPRMAKKGQRTTHRSVAGTKLYAVRDATGKFKDIQTYKRAHGQDIKRKSKKEK